jgi:hypothetical protein
VLKVVNQAVEAGREALSLITAWAVLATVAQSRSAFLVELGR